MVGSLQGFGQVFFLSRPLWALGACAWQEVHRVKRDGSFTDFFSLFNKAQKHSKKWKDTITDFLSVVLLKGTLTRKLAQEI